jgi:hypothetical protein
MGGLDPTQKKSGPGLGFRPSPIVFSKGVFGKTHPYAFGHNFYAHSSLIFGQTSPFLISENSKNIWVSLLIYLWAMHFDFFFLSLCFVFFFFAMCLIGGLVLLNVNMSCNVFFFLIFFI